MKTKNQMNVIENDMVVFCDCDDTLVSWLEPTIPGPEKVSLDFAGKTVYLTPHQYHIDLLRTYNERGFYIIVWSANGNAHSRRVVEALGIEDLVSGKNGHIQSKGVKWLDDNPDAASHLGMRVFCPDITKSITPFVSLK